MVALLQAILEFVTKSHCEKLKEEGMAASAKTAEETS